MHISSSVPVRLLSQRCLNFSEEQFQCCVVAQADKFNRQNLNLICTDLSKRFHLEWMFKHNAMIVVVLGTCKYAETDEHERIIMLAQHAGNLQETISRQNKLESNIIFTCKAIGSYTDLQSCYTIIHSAFFLIFTINGTNQLLGNYYCVNLAIIIQPSGFQASRELANEFILRRPCTGL